MSRSEQEQTGQEYFEENRFAAVVDHESPVEVEVNQMVGGDYDFFILAAGFAKEYGRTCLARDEKGRQFMVTVEQAKAVLSSRLSEIIPPPQEPEEQLGLH